MKQKIDIEEYFFGIPNCSYTTPKQFARVANCFGVV